MTRDEFRTKLIKGLELSFERLVKAKAKEDGILVFSENGKIVKVKARDLEKQIEAKRS